MRFSAIYDLDPEGRMAAREAQQESEAGGAGGTESNMPDNSGQASTPTPTEVETPTDTPGPASRPQASQGGQPQRTPPATAVGQGAGLQASEATGGLQGSFAQAGDLGFAKRFGGEAPATWFRNFAREGAPGSTMGSTIPGGNRDATTRGGQQAGGSIPSASAIPSMDDNQSQAGGSDEEWQRFIQAVMQQRFGVNGRN